MEIRFVAPEDDRGAISRVYEESWKFAYRGIIPEDYLESIPKGRWADSVDREGRHSLILLDQGKIVGTSCIGRSRLAELSDWGEIISLYLLPEYIGKGLGYALLQAAFSELVRLGFSSVYLWVLEENKRARHFYEKVGFVESGKILDDVIGGKALREIQYIRNCPHKDKRTSFR